MLAIAPISVAMPVAVTTARPVPCATAVPLNTMSSRSPSGAGAGRVAASFSTASLSPVSEASCTRSAAARTSRASAPTASPSPSTSTSPRTSSALGMRSSSPSRKHRARSRRSCGQRGDRVLGLGFLHDSRAPRSSTTISAITIASDRPAVPAFDQPRSEGDDHRGQQQVDQRVLELRAGRGARWVRAGPHAARSDHRRHAAAWPRPCSARARSRRRAARRPPPRSRGSARLLVPGAAPAGRGHLLAGKSAHPPVASVALPWNSWQFEHFWSGACFGYFLASTLVVSSL